LQVSVSGLGYIGLPTAGLLARSGYIVNGVDTNPIVLESIKLGKPNIVEPDLEALINEAYNGGRLTLTLQPVPADIFLITVPTPFIAETGGLPIADLQYVNSAALAIAKVLKKGDLVILESTSPVGTTESMWRLLSEESCINPEDFSVAYCPERLLPGNTIQELQCNNRIVGGVNPYSSAHAADFYASFCQGQVLQTDARTAELVKLAENSYRDVNIAFANELSLICDHLDIDVYEAIALTNHHPRVNVLKPGCGVGGHCISVDPWFLAAAAPHCSALIQTARKVNSLKVKWVIDQILERISHFHLSINRPIRLGVLGLSFKPDINDLRESPALEIATSLLAKGIDLIVCEPNLQDHPSIKLHELNYVLEHSDILVFLVAHTSFTGIDLTGRQVLDFCGVTDSN
tara:strand:+ start:695 stop:1906 length:1212 start_codon:yes stop_codon:yes gene_type:complete